MAALLPAAKKQVDLPSERTPDFRVARSCYDHLAGRVAVEICQALQQKALIFADGEEFKVSPGGERWFREFGLDLDALSRQRRIFAKKCLDWSERKYHVAGALGASLLKELLEREWLAKSHDRILRVTLAGRKNLDSLFGIVW